MGLALGRPPGRIYFRFLAEWCSWYTQGPSVSMEPGGRATKVCLQFFGAGYPMTNLQNTETRTGKTEARTGKTGKTDNMETWT